MTFQTIPDELREYPQFVCWKLVERANAKPTKVPFNALTGAHASVTNPADWCSYADAVAMAENYSGVGFVLTKNDPFSFIDLDATHGDAEAITLQSEIFTKLNSYSERSPSGNGLHIIARATLPGPGRRRAHAELYDCDRYMTMTGDAFHSVPIMARQPEIDWLYARLGGGPGVQLAPNIDAPQTQADVAILEMARMAVNGEKFSDIYDGDWQKHFGPQFGHQGIGQSEADMALIDMLAFYSPNEEQIIRMFYASQLGARYKTGNVKHNVRKIGYMIAKCRDNRPPIIDSSALNAQFEEIAVRRRGEIVGASGKPSGKPEAPSGFAISQDAAASTDLVRSRPASTECVFPKGLVGRVAQFFYDAAPTPVKEIALVGAIGFMAGITGRAYNVGGSGLNQYIILIADTGRGKEGIKNGISRLSQALSVTSDNIKTYEGPGKISSSQALTKWLTHSPSCCSVVGEFGIKLRQMSDEKSPHLVAIRADLLDLYHKSGYGQSFGAQAYAKKDDCEKAIASPAFTLVGESTPISFYENINEDVIADGLLPRFTIFTFEGDQVPPNKGHEKVMPEISLLTELNSLIAQATAICTQNTVCSVEMTPEARKVMDDFGALQRSHVNNRDPATGLKLPTKPNQVRMELWNRAYIKAARLAAVLAVGVSPWHPCIDEEQAKWATNEIFWQITALADRFKSGEVGGGAINAPANEEKQTEVMCHKILGLATGMTSTGQYKIDADMRAARVFPYNLLLQTLRIYPCFKNDRRGASEAIKKIYGQLIDSGDLIEISKPQMLKDYGRLMRAFQIVNADRFFDAAA